MNITTEEAGSVDGEHILSKGFEVFDNATGSDMGNAHGLLRNIKTQNVRSLEGIGIG